MRLLNNSIFAVIPVIGFAQDKLQQESSIQ